MTETELELARRLVAHPGWQWMRGMIATTTRTVDGLDVVDCVIRGSAWFGDDDSCSAPYCTPAIDQPATQGCLIAMIDDLRELRQLDGRWTVDRGERMRCVSTWCDTRGEALARALLAAWGEP